MAYIELEHIQKSFDGQSVLGPVSLSVEKGAFMTLLGPSGCGKTTLLRALAGLTRVDDGRILIRGEDLTYAEPKKRSISMIFQQYSLFPTMTVYRNVAFGLKMQKIAKPEIDRRVHEALEMVDLLGSEKKYPSQLSGGEQQRVALARAIVTKAQILLLDEPFSAIDAKLRKALQIKIREIHQELGLTTIFVTHDQEEAMRMSDRICLINHGQVEQEGTPTDLYLNPATPFVAGFIGHYNIYHRGQTTWAIRPEAITMSRVPWENPEDAFACCSGKIRQVIPQGNIIRYMVETDGGAMDVDMLFEAQNIYRTEETVYLRYLRSQVREWCAQG
jgi:putative spermidine/putrescine transport system ATP-binding protein